ncbi:MAG: enoyl-ACP reductase [Gemmatimonadota bacterium]
MGDGELLEGKKGLVFGIANQRSYAYHITESILEAGGEPYFSHLPGEKMERRLVDATSELGIEDPWREPCDVSEDEHLDNVFDRYGEEVGQLDFVVHSVAFADRQYLKEGNFWETPREAWNEALEISAYSLVAMAQRAAPLMDGNGSMVSMTYYGGEKVVPAYNVMGIAKAALEHSTRYLASDLGEMGVRVNTISGGPLKTASAMAVGGIREMFDLQEERAPLGRNIEGEEVGDTVAFLLSDRASAITGETVHVDGGFSVTGM